LILAFSGGTLFVLRFWIILGNISQRLTLHHVILVGLLG